jgi:hypothetical protein
MARYLVVAGLASAAQMSVSPDGATAAAAAAAVPAGGGGGGVWQSSPYFRSHLDGLLYAFRAHALDVLLLGDGRECEASAAAWRSYLPAARVSGPQRALPQPTPLSAWDVVVDCAGAGASARDAPTQEADLEALFDGPQGGLKPGGLLVYEGYGGAAGDTAADAFSARLLRLVDTLHRGSFELPADAAGDAPKLGEFPQHHINVQTVTLCGGGGDSGGGGGSGGGSGSGGGGRVAVLTRKGALDDQEYMINGDYGTQYGEARHGLFSRALHRGFRVPWEARRQRYFEQALALLPARLHKLVFTMRAPREHDDAESGGAVSFALRADAGGGRLRVGSAAEAKLCLLRDVEFALSTHRERMEVSDFPSEADEAGGTTDRVEVTVRAASALPAAGAAGALRADYALHGKKGVWKSWRRYFGPRAAPQPLSVLAQNVREKFLMVSRDDDQSDLYKGRCSRALTEDAFDVVLHAPDCAALAPALKVHGLRCAASEGEGAADTGAADGAADGADAAYDRVAAHSPLYYLHVKAKWDGYIGLPPVGNHARDDVTDPPHVEAMAEPDGPFVLGARGGSGGRGAQQQPGDDFSEYQVGSARLRRRLEAFRADARFGGVAMLMDAGAGVLDYPPQQQRAAWEAHWARHVRPGGLFAVDGLFHGDHAPMQREGAYATLWRAIAEEQVRGAGEAGGGPPRDVGYILFNTNNVVVAKAGDLRERPAWATGVAAAVADEQGEQGEGGDGEEEGEGEEERRDDDDDEEEEKGEQEE